MSKKKLVIFGLGDVAELAYYYFSVDSDFQVVAFTVDKNYIQTNSFNSLPIVPYEDLHDLYPPSEYFLFIAIGYSKVNLHRRNIFNSAKDRGYRLSSYISTSATILNSRNIGENCFILEDNTIQPYVEIQDNVFLWSGNHIGHHTRIHSHTFIASHVVISGGVEVGEQCFIGVNATLRDRIKIGDRCVIGAGALLLMMQNQTVFILEKQQHALVYQALA